MKTTSTYQTLPRADRRRVLRRFLGSLVASTPLAFAAACGGSASADDTPTEAAGEKAVAEAVSQQSGGRIKLVAYRKTNATNGDLMGVAYHAQEFEAELEFAEEASWMIGFKSGPFSLERAGYGMGKPVEPGQRETFKGEIEFVSSEKGWQVRGIDYETPSPY